MGEIAREYASTRDLSDSCHRIRPVETAPLGFPYTRRVYEIHLETDRSEHEAGKPARTYRRVSQPSCTAMHAS